MRIEKIFLSLFLGFLIVFSAAAGEIKLKILVVNPSETDKKVSKVKYQLPKGINPENILDRGEMNLTYNFEEGVYFVYQEIELKPAEQRVLEIILQDIWIIEDKEVKFLKKHTGELLEKLKSTKHYDVGVTLFNKIKEQMEQIEQKQKMVNLNVKEKISIYYDSIGILNEAKDDIGMMENLVVDLGGIVEDRVKVASAMTVSLEGGSQEQSVELNVKLTNPSKSRKTITDVVYYLPEEITPRHVLTRGDLAVNYDFNKERFYLYKEKVELLPSETKEYKVELKDIWWISEAEIESLRARTVNLMLFIKGTEYFDQGKILSEKIYENLEEILKTQSLKVSVDKHIAYYRHNMDLLEEAKQYISQLEKIVSRTGTELGVTIVDVEKLQGGGSEIKRVKGYEGIKLIAKSIFKGKAPEPATTWKIIFTILVFIGLVSVAFFILWYAQIKRKTGGIQPEEDPKKEKKEDNAT